MLLRVVRYQRLGQRPGPLVELKNVDTSLDLGIRSSLLYVAEDNTSCISVELKLGA